MNMIPDQHARTTSPEANRVIAYIAFQTSLLALHAAIEAASTGDAPGRDASESVPVPVRVRRDRQGA